MFPIIFVLFISAAHFHLSFSSVKTGLLCKVLLFGRMDNKMATDLNTVGLSSIPDIPIANILSYLSPKDLSYCCRVNRSFNEIGSTSLSWKKWCKHVWLLDVSEPRPSRAWKNVFIEHHRKWGKYGDCYTPIRKAWNQIEEFTRDHCPQIYTSLNPGLSEEEMDRICERHLRGKKLVAL